MSDAPAPPDTTLPDRFSPEEVRRILQRASEIDAHGEHAEVDELLRIARDAGIDLRAMEQAMAEVASGVDRPLPVPTEAPSAKPVRAQAPDTMVRSILSAAGFGVGAGLVIGLIPDLYGLALGSLFVYSLVRAVQLGRKGGLLEFELQNLVLMLVSGLTALPFLGFMDDELLAGVLVVWMVMTVLGGLVTWWRGRSGDDPEAV